MDLEDDELETFYNEHFTPLVETVMEQFEYSRSGAQKRVDEAFGVALSSQPKVVDIKSWIIGALTYAARRKRGDA